MQERVKIPLLHIVVLEKLVQTDCLKEIWVPILKRINHLNTLIQKFNNFLYFTFTPNVQFTVLTARVEIWNMVCPGAVTEGAWISRGQTLEIFCVTAGKIALYNPFQWRSLKEVMTLICIRIFGFCWPFTTTKKNKTTTPISWCFFATLRGLSLQTKIYNHIFFAENQIFSNFFTLCTGKRKRVLSLRGSF